MPQAAAIAMRQTETGVITVRGALGPLLICLPYQPVESGAPARPTVPRPPPRAPRHSPADSEAALKDVFEAAKTDQTTARWILQCLTWRLRSTAAFEREHERLITMCVIPAESLPEANERDFSRPGPFGRPAFPCPQPHCRRLHLGLTIRPSEIGPLPAAFANPSGGGGTIAVSCAVM